MKSSGKAGLGALLKNPGTNEAEPPLRDVEEAECTKPSDFVRVCPAGRSAFSFPSPLFRVKVRLRGRAFFGLPSSCVVVSLALLTGHGTSPSGLNPVPGREELPDARDTPLWREDRAILLFLMKFTLTLVSRDLIFSRRFGSIFLDSYRDVSTVIPIGEDRPTKTASNSWSIALGSTGTGCFASGSVSFAFPLSAATRPITREPRLPIVNAGCEESLLVLRELVLDRRLGGLSES
jgi:hypothetical protein